MAQSFHTSTGTLDEKRLKDDFEVLEYLRINKHSDDNNQNYLKFVNQLLFAKKLKQDRLHNLNQCMENKCESVENKREYDDQSIQDINTKFHHEIGVRGDLEREVEECKKSIRLLRGDIGHIVKRNQSEKMLSSKINKVNIIALDQYKKVNNEYSKEKEEVKELKGMREIFMQRLKNVSRIQKNGLVKTEQSFLQLLRKHRGVQSKLNQIQRNGSMIEQYSEMKRKTQNKIQTITYTIQFLKETAELVHSPESEFILRNFHKSDRWTLKAKTDALSDLSIAVLERLSSFCKIQSIKTTNKEVEQNIDQILSVFYTLSNNISTLSSVYNEDLKKLETLKQTLMQFQGNNEETISYSQQMKSTKDIGEDMIQQNTQQHLKCLYTFLNFFSSIKQSNQLFLTQLISHISKSKQQRLNSHLFHEWSKKMENAIDQIREINLEQAHGPQEYKSRFGDKTTDETVNSLHQDRERETRNISTKSMILKQGLLSDFNESSFRRNTIRMTKQPICKSMSIESNSLERCKAKRIKFLERIDQDYYKMLKQTLQMEKQYTGSNYKFMRRFKMDKYVKRDNIYREKQFESSFSVLWSSKQANSAVFQSKTRPVKSLHAEDVFQNIPLDKSMKAKSNSTVFTNKIH